jgi:putative addiction module component (TIGR02574 family)
MGLMTIEKRVLRWPAAKKVALAEKLLDSVENFASREIEEAWESELKERVMEIEKGKAVGIPANAAFSKAHRILSEARDGSSR